MRRRGKGFASIVLVGCFVTPLVIGSTAGAGEQRDAGPTGRTSVAIVRHDLATSPAAASPESLAKALGDAGYDVEFMDFDALLDPKRLTAQQVEVLILPDGVHYPAGGKGTLVRYLKESGAFFSTGGYAFDEPVTRTATGWQVLDDTKRSEVKINTRLGQSGDTMYTAPDQIGVFDPGYLLTDVVSVEPAPQQHVLTGRFRIEGPLEGFAATALTGRNQPVFPDVYARWIPLLNTYDSYGRLRGTAMAIIHHYAGPFKGSSWAICGATTRDILKDGPMARDGVVEIVGALRQKTFLHELRTDWACYRPGEPVKPAVNVSNHGRQSRQVTVDLHVEDTVVASETIELGPGQTREIVGQWQPPQGQRGRFLRVTSTLRADGRVIDEMSTGFVIWDEELARTGPRIEYADNYFRIDGRPAFLTGTNQTGMMWYSAGENPAVWDRDFARMRDHGLRLLRILHFSSFAAQGYEGKAAHTALDLKNRPEKLIRQTDAMVQLAQQRGIVFFLSLHDWLGVDLTDEELAAQKDWARFWVERYRNVPGIIWDIQNEPHVKPREEPHVRRMFNDYLRDKYGTTEKLQAAWRVNDASAQLGQVDPTKEGDKSWPDVRTRDVNLFRVRLLDRWIKANAEGIRAGDPEAIFTVGYLPSMPPADKILGVAHQTFSNMHWYGPIGQFPLEFKLIDRRFDGKSLSLGEFGAQEAHDARVHGRNGHYDAESVARYLATVHYVLGLGGSFAADWCWKDFDDSIFPWGANHAHDMVSKAKLKAFRAMGVFFGRFQPRYQPPDLYLLLPDNHRLGGKFNEVHAALHNAVRLLMECHVSFNVISEHDLDRLPAEARAIVYPIPYCPDDAVFERLPAFVKSGGSLCFSGDIAYDAFLNRTRADRFSQLGLADPGDREPLAFLAGDGKITPSTSKVGKGHVTFTPVPIEVRGTDRHRETYKAFLTRASVKRIGLDPDLSSMHAFSTPARDGGSVFVLFNAEKTEQGEAKAKTVTLTDTEAHVSLAVAPGKPGLAWLGPRGELQGVETSGAVTANGKPVLTAEGLTMLTSLDGRALSDSRQLLVLPIEPGRLTMPGADRWRQPTAVVGEVELGQWRELERWPLASNDGALTIEVTPQRALTIMIVAEPDAVDQAVRQVVSGLGR